MIHEKYSTAAMWMSVGAAVVTAIIFTQSATPMWFFLIPFIGTVYEKYEKK